MISDDFAGRQYQQWLKEQLAKLEPSARTELYERYERSVEEATKTIQAGGTEVDIGGVLEALLASKIALLAEYGIDISSAETD